MAIQVVFQPRVILYIVGIENFGTLSCQILGTFCMILFHSKDSEGACVIAAIVLYFEMYAQSVLKMFFYKWTSFSVHLTLFSFLGKKGLSLAGFLVTFMYVYSFLFWF